LEVPTDLQTSTLDFDFVRAEFNSFTATLEEVETNKDELDGNKKLTEPMDFESIIHGSHISLDPAVNYAQRLGASLSLAPQGHAFINGKHFEMGGVSFSI
jgi:UDP-glucose:glycoprotein glucosyltransferase